MAPARRRPSRFPRVYAGGRRRLVWRLVANGAVQGVLAFALAGLLRSGLRSARAGVVDGVALGAIGAAGVLALVLRVAEAGDAERLGQHYVTSVRLRLFERIAARPIDASGRPLGVTMARMISDLNALRNWVSTGIARGTVAAVMVVGLLAALARIEPRLGATLAAIVALALLGAAALTPGIRARVRESRRRRGRLANNLGEKLVAFHTVRNFGRTRAEARRLRVQSRRLREALVGRTRTAQVLRSLPGLALPLSMAAVVWLSQTRLGPGEVAASVLLCGMLVAQLRDLARAWDYRLAFDEGRRRIDQALTAPRLVEPKPGLELPGQGPLAVAIENVPLPGAGRHLCCEAAPGDVVLVAGPSGSGKSTLLALAARLLDAAEGEVRLDGIPVRRVASDALAFAVQLVAPELPLLRGTIRDNLVYGVGDDGDAWLSELVTLCDLDDPRLLPDGLDTPVETQGANLSRGLRARLALARAAAMRPRLLLVDDPHFSLDPVAGCALQKVIAALGATALVVGSETHPPVSPDRVWRLEAPPANARTGSSRAANP